MSLSNTKNRIQHQKPDAFWEFDNSKALNINQARLSHLKSLELNLSGKKVLDAGCGIGHLAPFFKSYGCSVVCIDARRENIEELKRRHPDIPAYVCNVETDNLQQFGGFDIVFCYGLLYHLENPIKALRNLKAVCLDTMLIETIVMDHELPLSLLVDETPHANQAVQGIGSRFTPSYLLKVLVEIGWPYIYFPKTCPEHPDFNFRRLNNFNVMRNGYNLRSIFIASNQALDNKCLTLISV